MRQIGDEAELQRLRLAGLGLIYNDFSGKGASGSQYNVLHAADCAYLARANLSVPKYYFADIDEAMAWLLAHRGKEGVAWKCCGTCKANTLDDNGVTCPACGTNCQPTARHCPNCGIRINGVRGPSDCNAPPPPTRTTTNAPQVAGGNGAQLLPDTLLQGRYRIVRMLGAGAFGRVYLADDAQDSSSPQLAIKELLDAQFPLPDDKRDAIAWFKREVSNLLTLDHPAIPTIYGYWTAQRTAGPLYLAMDYIPGKTLAWIIHENIYRNGLAADGGFRRPQSPLGVPKSVLEPIQRPKRMNMQLNMAELIRQKCS